MRGYISVRLKIVASVLVTAIVVGLVIVKVFYNREEYIIATDSGVPNILVPYGVKIHIDVDRVVTDTHKFLSKDDISSEVFAFNHMNGDVYNYKRQDFYDILSIAKEVFMCSDGQISPVSVSGSLDSILINKTTAKKLTSNVQIDLDDFVGVCVLKNMSREVEKQKIHDYCLQYEDDLLLCGNQNKTTYGWNISKLFKYIGKSKIVVSEKQEEKEKPVYSIPYEFKKYCVTEYKDPFEKIINLHTANDDVSNIEQKNVEQTTTINLVGLKDKALCFIQPKSDNGIIGGVVIADDLFLARAITNVGQHNDFLSVDTISSRLRYHDCQYFILYYNDDGMVECQKSFGLCVKEKSNCWRVELYGR